MKDLDIIIKLNHLLEINGWELVDNEYIHKNGTKLAFPENRNPEHRLLSPSSLLSYINCHRKLFLFKNSENRYNFYTNLIGNKVKLQEIERSIESLYGIIIHEVLSKIGKYVKPISSDLEGIGWRTVLAPIIHCSVINSLSRYPNYITNDLDINIVQFEKKVTKIIDEVWFKPFLQIGFDKRTWKENFNNLYLSCEKKLSKKNFLGVADLIIEWNNKNYVIDYKTTKYTPSINKNNFNDKETYNILNSSKNELYPYVLQITCYCLMIDGKEVSSSGWLVFTSEENIRIMKFNIGHSSKNSISQLINKTEQNLNSLKKNKYLPKGKYSPIKCKFCPFKINCIDFYQGSKKINYVKWYKNQGKNLPILAKVDSVFPATSKINIFLNDEEFYIALQGNHKKYLEFVESNLKSGHDICCYMELYGSIHRIKTNTAIFTRCE